MESPFSPGTTETLSASTSSASVTLDGDTNQVRVYNATAAVAFIRFTTDASTAVNTDTPIAPGSVEVFTKAANKNIASAILASGTGSVYFTIGHGS